MGYSWPDTWGLALLQILHAGCLRLGLRAWHFTEGDRRSSSARLLFVLAPSLSALRRRVGQELVVALLPWGLR